MFKMGSTKLKRFEPYRAVILAVLLYYAIRLVFYAVMLSPYVPPDEVTHFGMCRVFAQTCLLPDNTSETWTFGQVTHQPYLYYWLMGRLLNLNLFGLPDLLFLRFANVGITLATAVLALLWIRLVTDNRVTQGLFVVMLTNTPMYSVVGASVSYDNLTIASAVLALYGLHRFKLAPSASALLVAGIAVLAGALTKKAYLPLVAIYVVLGLYLVARALKRGWPATRPLKAGVSVCKVIGLGLVLLLLILNVRLYGGNLWQYGRLIPATDQVLTVEQAMQYRIYARNRIVRLYREGDRSYAEAAKMAAKIDHPGDRRATRYLLHLAKRQTSHPVDLMNRGQYAAFWWHTMMQGLMGISGHLSMPKPWVFLAVCHVILFLALVILVVSWRKYQPKILLVDAALIFGCYALILMQGVNYPIYRQFYSPVLALQGRYLLPVIVPLYGLVACGFLEPFKTNWLKGTVFVLLASFFVWGDFVYFLQNVDPAWYGRPFP
jgi:hypothetical protein